MTRVVLSIAAVGVFSIALVSADPPGAIRKAPELAFTIPDQGQKLLSEYRGKVVALEFILTTCPHCQAASRVMSKFQEEFGSRGFQALDIAINALDYGSDPKSANQIVTNFARQFQVAFPVGWTTRDQMMAFMGFSMAERFVVPQLVLIDRKGFIHYQTPPLGNEEHEKEMNPDTVRQRIEELLAVGNSGSRHSSRATKAVATRNPQ